MLGALKRIDVVRPLLRQLCRRGIAKRVQRGLFTSARLAAKDVMTSGRQDVTTPVGRSRGRAARR